MCSVCGNVQYHVLKHMLNPLCKKGEAPKISKNGSKWHTQNVLKVSHKQPWKISRLIPL